MSPCRNDLRAISFMGDHCTGQFQVQINAISQEITHVKLALKEFSTSVMRCLSDIQRRFDSIPSSSRHESFTSYDSEPASNAPTARLCESVTTKIPPAKNLDDVVKQWYRGDPEAGLMRPLKSWSPLDRKGKVSKAFSTRKVVITEYEKIGDDAVFRNLYRCSPLNALLEDIRLVKSKNKWLTASWTLE